MSLNFDLARTGGIFTRTTTNDNPNVVGGNEDVNNTLTRPCGLPAGSPPGGGVVVCPTFTIPTRRGLPVNLTEDALLDVLRGAARTSPAGAGSTTRTVLQQLPIGDVVLANGKETVAPENMGCREFFRWGGSPGSPPPRPFRWGGSVMGRITPFPWETTTTTSTEENLSFGYYLSFRDSLQPGAEGGPAAASRGTTAHHDLSSAPQDRFVPEDKVVVTRETFAPAKKSCSGSSPGDPSNQPANTLPKEKDENKAKKTAALKPLAFDNTIHGTVKLQNPEQMLVDKFSDFDLIAQPSEALPAVCGRNRAQRCVERDRCGLVHLLGLIERRRRGGKLAPADSANPGVLAVVSGGNFGGLRRLAAAHCAVHADKVVGFVISGLGCGETMADRAKILDTVCGGGGSSSAEICRGAGLDRDEATENKPRFLPLGVGSPAEILLAAGQVDVFEISYPVRLALAGVALVFDPVVAPVDNSIPASTTSPQLWYLDLTDPSYKHDFSPIDGVHSWPEEQAYTRAYLHHLLGLQELLAYIALVRHNLRKYNLFFQELRSQMIQQGAQTGIQKYVTYLASKYPGLAPSDVVVVNNKTGAEPHDLGAEQELVAQQEKVLFVAEKRMAAAEEAMRARKSKRKTEDEGAKEEQQAVGPVVREQGGVEKGVEKLKRPGEVEAEEEKQQQPAKKKAKTATTGDHAAA